MSDLNSFIEDYYRRKRNPRVSLLEEVETAMDGEQEQPEPQQDAGSDAAGDPQQLVQVVMTALKEIFPGIEVKKWMPKKQQAILTNTGNRAQRDEAWQQVIARFKGKLSFESAREEEGMVLGVKVGSGDTEVIILLAQGSASGASVANRGDVAEGILSAALAARFAKPEDGSPVTQQEVVTLLDQLNAKDNESSSANTIKKTLVMSPSKNADGSVTDQVTLVIGLSKNNFTDLMSAEKRGSVSDLFASSVEYANSGRVLDQTIEWFVNNVENKIQVIADGTSDQKGTKVDVRILDNGAEISIGKISLKAGATKQLGQIGKTFESLSGMFNTLFGVQLSDRQKQNWEQKTSKDTNADLGQKNKGSASVRMAAQEIYAEAESLIQAQLSGDDAEAEKEFLERFAAGIRYQAVLEEGGVELVHLSHKTFKVLDFYDTLDDVIANKVNFAAKLLVNSGGTPYLYIFDGNKGASPSKDNALIQIRPKVEKEGLGPIRHYVEKMDYLVELLSIKPKE
tara:strand:+ start:506 stop:2038 length:1533 start_codon:yes stop_codon:yes gene_type:complete